MAAAVLPSFEPYYNDSLSMEDNVNDIYSKLLGKATGCANIPSLSAPPFSTEFVKSSYTNRAQPGVPGAFAEITFPSPQESKERARRKHSGKDLFGYISTAAADILPAGYGERSAKALEREDTIYQLKGTFISASIAMSKLRARVEARSGDVSSINRIFSRMWGISESDAEMIPHLHVSGSEHTRMAAMEDRAYHSLAGHPAYTGGFRVDMATIAPDALGEDVPLNWARLRTGLKTVAHIQNDADIAMTDMRCQLGPGEPVKLYMDLAVGGQPKYVRSSPWEIVLDQLMQSGSQKERKLTIDRSNIAGALMQTYADQRYRCILEDPELWIYDDVTAIAHLAKEQSQQALTKAITAIRNFEQDRALIEMDVIDEFETFSDSQLTRVFEVPKYKVVRESWRGSYTEQKLGRSRLPDIDSHGKPQRFLNVSEIRESTIMAPISVPGALHMAVYFISHQRSMSIPCYRLLQEVRDPKPGAKGKVSSRLRSPALYRSQVIRSIGRELFGEEFRSIFETLLRNLATPSTLNDMDIKSDIWRYMSGRTGATSKCPIAGGWRDLINHLIDAEEGWTLFYWVRVALGKTQHAMSNSILAPIIAGEPVDFLTLISRGMQERALRWKAHYEAAYQKMEDDLDLPTKRRRQRDKEKCLSLELENKYVPPHLRDRALVEARADKAGILTRRRGLDQSVYERLVELQTKIKFFSRVKVVTHDRQLAVGMSDADLRELFIEFYQMRWYSLELRIQKSLKRNKPFFLGPYKFEAHPWGELATTFPPTLDELITWTNDLLPAAWTRTPAWLLERVRKSIGELWMDVSKEIQTALDYIEQVEDCLADDQATALAERRVSTVLRSLSDIPAISLPSVGYIAPYEMPERRSQLVDYTGDPTAQTQVTRWETGQRLLDPIVQDPKPNQSTEGALNFDFEEDDDDDEPFVMCAPSQTSVDDFAIDTSRSLTYREIWAALNLDDATDEKIRFAFGVDAATDLDAEHLDPQIGPPVLTRDADKAARLWKPRLGGMLKRLGKVVAFVPVDDM